MLKSMDMNSYWDKVSLACAADDYVRSKQQQDNREQLQFDGETPTRCKIKHIDQIMFD